MLNLDVLCHSFKMELSQISMNSDKHSHHCSLDNNNKHFVLFQYNAFHRKSINLSSHPEDLSDLLIRILFSPAHSNITSQLKYHFFIKLVKMSCILLDGVDGKGCGWVRDGGRFFNIYIYFVFFCFVFVLSVVRRAYRILVYAMIVS